MTVSTLIGILKGMPQNAIIVSSGSGGDSYEITNLDVHLWDNRDAVEEFPNEYEYTAFVTIG